VARGADWPRRWLVFNAARHLQQQRQTLVQLLAECAPLNVARSRWSAQRLAHERLHPAAAYALTCNAQMDTIISVAVCAFFTWATGLIYQI
jgi:hypothetical protein